MTKRIFITHQRGVDLVAAGCPLDYLDALPHHSASQRKTFWVDQLSGYIESCVYLFGPRDVGYVIALRIRTERPSGVIIREWSVEGPWPDHAICWDYESRDVIPKADVGAYENLLDSRLMQVLDDRYRVRRDHPIEGLLCGYSYQAVPQFRDLTLPAKVILVDDNGNRFALRVEMVVVRRFLSSWRKRPTRAGQHCDDDGPMPSQ